MFAFVVLDLAFST